jgi:uncharacterized protein
MPALLQLKSTDWELTVWCNDISARQNMLKKTMYKHGKVVSPSQILFSEPLNVELNLSSPSASTEALTQTLSVPFIEPVFFENTQYQFEWVFSNTNIVDASVNHKLTAIYDAFRFTRSAKTGEARLFGVINTANDIGWLRLPLRYSLESGQSKTISLSFEVMPVKMDMHSHLITMYQTIDREYPLWRFSLAEKTEQSVSRGLKLGYFPLIWLAHFEQLRAKMMSGLKVISQSPHSRLQNTERYTKAEKLKGKLSPKQIETVRQDLANGLFDKRYLQTKKHLSLDTPENRFIKMVVKTTKTRLADFHRKLVKFNQVPESQRLTDAFISQIYDWQAPFTQFQKQSFINEIGEFSGLSSESLVLQQKTGYSAVYKVWQELKFYLDIFSNQASVSMKTIAEIYEVWCFLELRRILVEELGFSDVMKNNNALTLKELEYKLKDGFGGAFEFERGDIKIRLAHEPVFRHNTTHIRTYWVTQKPDILMEVTFGDKRKCVWLFDAKYRIVSDQQETDLLDATKQDYVPEDALNQMHRYRDALIRIESENGLNDKSRPVFGAFALYPGFYNQTEEPNPYDSVIDEVGIGAFALLPSAESNQGNQWLIGYLRAQIGLSNYPIAESLERLYVQESARIPYQGMKQVLYPDLVLTVASPNKKGRDLDYVKKFEDGTSQWYHIPLSTFVDKYEKHVAQELAYLAIGVIQERDTTRKIMRVWRIKNLTLKKRHELTIEQAGKLDGSNELYWLFELEPSMLLSETIEHLPIQNFRHSMKLTTLRALNQTSNFAELETVYENAIAI